MNRTTVWEFQCPVDDFAFSSSGNEQGEVVENAQQHTGDAHGDMPPRDEIEGNVIGPG